MTINRRELLKRTVASLAGITSATTLASLISACEKSAVSESSQFKDKKDTDFFSPHQMQTVSLLAEIIIPETDTPGAIAAGVPGFIESVVKDVFSYEDREQFNEGLFSLDLFCSKRYEKNYIEIPAHKQVKIANHFNMVNTKNNLELKQVLLSKGQVSEKALDSALKYFAIVKELSIFGFYTSEVGATQVLQYNPIPGRYDGCANLSEIGKTWATPQ